MDEYTSGELTLLFENATESRLALLRKLQRKGSLPNVIVQLALKDEDPRIRHKLALAKRSYLRKEVVETLRPDAEPIVRAAVCENSAFLSVFRLMRGQVELFKSLAHIERLAVMRNPRVNSEMVEKIFDREDKELELSEIERAQLLFSYLANTDVFDARRLDSESYEKAGVPNYDAYDFVRTHQKHFDSVWKMAETWDWWDVRAAVYATVPVDDNLKFEAYKREEHEWARQCILRACTPGDTVSFPRAAPTVVLLRCLRDRSASGIFFSEASGHPGEPCSDPCGVSC